MKLEDIEEGAELRWLRDGSDGGYTWGQGGPEPQRVTAKVLKVGKQRVHIQVIRMAGGKPAGTVEKWVEPRKLIRPGDPLPPIEEFYGPPSNAARGGA